jgi:DNA-binding transcriptional ArsR family regulator
MEALEPRQSKATREAEREDIGLRIARALAHPLRVRILEILSEGDASPVEIAMTMDRDKRRLGNVNYHVKILRDLGCVEQVGMKPVRGTFKRIYQSRMRVMFSDLCWSSLGQQVRSEVSITVLRNILRRTGDALEANTFDRKDDRHLSLQTVPVDCDGWEELRELMATTMHEVDAISARAIERGAEQFPATVTLLNFESPRLYEVV